MIVRSQIIDLYETTTMYAFFLGAFIEFTTRNIQVTEAPGSTQSRTADVGLSLFLSPFIERNISFIVETFDINATG